MKAFFHPDQHLHRPLSYYSRGKLRAPQELPARSDALLHTARRLGFEILAPADPGPLPLTEVHSADYLTFLESAHRQWMALQQDPGQDEGQDWGPEVVSNIFVREPNALRGVLAQAGRYLADGSCPVGEHTWRSALASAHGAVAAADALGQQRLAYALCRPPGHHARRDAAGGFCYLNNAAIAAQRLRGRFERVAILDTDMHHGQGTQQIFYERADVLYVSIHADPENFYPAVAGFEEERGHGEGLGFNLNLPMPHGAPESAFFTRLDQACEALHGYAPQALVLSLGFDIYEHDPQSRVGVTAAGFTRLGQQIALLDLPTVVVQEGGYHLPTLEDNAMRFFDGLLGNLPGGHVSR